MVYEMGRAEILALAEEAARDMALAVCPHSHRVPLIDFPKLRIVSIPRERDVSSRACRSRCGARHSRAAKGWDERAPTRGASSTQSDVVIASRTARGMPPAWAV